MYNCCVSWLYVYIDIYTLQLCKYMPVAKKSHAVYPQYLEDGPYKFQDVHSFTYLWSDVNCNNAINAEIPKTYPSQKQVFPRIGKAFEVQTDQKKSTEVLIYEVLIRPLLTYASETWTVSETNERWLSLFEREALRCAFGVKQENETWAKMEQLWNIQSFYLNINKFDALNFIVNLFHASTYFEHYVLIIRWSKLYYTASGIITPTGDRPVHSPLSTCAPDGHLQVWWYQMLYNTILTSWWWAHSVRNM